MGTKAQSLIITANNRLQNLGDVQPDRTNALGNLSVKNPTIEQMNAAISGGFELSEGRDDDESELQRR